MKFRKKPVVVSAEQFFPEHEPWPEGVERRALMRCGSRSPVAYWISTLEGPANVSPGDWIITGIKGEKYPCRDDIFQATYEAEDPKCIACGEHWTPLEGVDATHVPCIPCRELRPQRPEAKPWPKEVFVGRLVPYKTDGDDGTEMRAGEEWVAINKKRLNEIRAQTFYEAAGVCERRAFDLRSQSTSASRRQAKANQCDDLALIFRTMAENDPHQDP